MEFGEKFNLAKIFYLGKSNELKNRISQHILTNKYKSKGTYALRLGFYTENHKNFEYSIDIFYLECGEGKNRALNELVESVLHQHLQPTIGTSR